jgi:2-methylcitrate dehydratase PrpD
VLDRTAVAHTRMLADFASTASLEDVPAAVQSRLKECLLDFIGNAAFAAVFAESSQGFRAGAAMLGGGTAASTVAGETALYTPMQAALLNGAFAHTLDFDDTNVRGNLHPGAPVIAAAIVEAERLHASGAELLQALAVGYEVACRIGEALGQTAYDRGFHITGVAGIFGAVAAAGRLRGIDGNTMMSAMGIAGSKAAGSMQYLSNGSWNKRLHPGFAAHDALLSLALAQGGVVGADAPLEGQYGLLAAYSNKSTPAALTDRLGTCWPSGETALKPFPSCRFNHTATEAALALREKIPAGEREAARLRVRLSPKGKQIVGEAMPNKLRACNIVDAQFSVYFQVAVAWLDGRCNWQSYDRLGDADVDNLSSSIEVVADDTLPVFAAEVIAGEDPGLAVRIDEPLGEETRPLDAGHVRRKFDELATPVFGAERAGQIATRFAAFEQERDASEFILLLRRGATP